LQHAGLCSVMALLNGMCDTFVVLPAHLERHTLERAQTCC
jgi:hypothetical protein